jgi:hypothetical protein
MREFTIEKLPGSQPEIQIFKLAGPFTLTEVLVFQETVRGGLSASL